MKNKTNSIIFTLPFSRNNILNLFLSSIILLFPLLGLSQKVVKIIPTKKQEEIILKGNKLYSYYKLKQENPISINIEGPGKLTVNVRVLLNEKEEQSTPFHFVYIKDKQKHSDKEIKALKKTTDILYGNRGVTNAHKIIINVPPGEHKYSLSKKNDKQESYINFKYEKQPSPEWVDLQPIYKLHQVRLVQIENKKILSYYRIANNDSLKITAKPGDYIRAYLRPEFKQNEISGIKSRIAVKLNDTILYTYSIRSKRCEKVVYENELQLIPGTLSEIYIRIPKNKNGNETKSNYSISLVEKNKTALIRLSIVGKVQKKSMITVKKKNKTTIQNKDTVREAKTEGVNIPPATKK
jgi:hypothetical protein